MAANTSQNDNRECGKANMPSVKTQNVQSI